MSAGKVVASPEFGIGGSGIEYIEDVTGFPLVRTAAIGVDETPNLVDLGGYHMLNDLPLVDQIPLHLDSAEFADPVDQLNSNTV